MFKQKRLPTVQKVCQCSKKLANVQKSWSVFKKKSWSTRKTSWSVLKKVGFHDRISIESAFWLKNVNRSKIDFDKSETSKRIVVPEPLVFYWFGGLAYLF